MPWSLAKPNHQPAAAAGSYSVQSPLAAAAKCVMRLENTFCCFPSPQCMLPALFYTVLCSVLAMFFWLLVFLLSSNLFFPCNNIPWFFCSSAAASLRNFVGKPCNFGSELSPLETQLLPYSQRACIGRLYFFFSHVLCSRQQQISFPFFHFLSVVLPQLQRPKIPTPLFLGLYFGKTLLTPLFEKKIL